MQSEAFNTKIAPLRSDEAQQVADLISATISSLSYYNDRAKAEEIAKYGTRELTEYSNADPDSVLVAYCNNRPVGFCISKYDDGLIWLSWFGVHKDYRHRGIGEILIRTLAGSLDRRRAHKIWCDTRTDNIQSQRLLRKMGFVKIAQLLNHWYGQDFFLWEWQP